MTRSETTNLHLKKHDNVTTNENAFDIENYLNANWDKIDTGYGIVTENQSNIETLQTENNNLRKALPNIKGTGTDITLNNTSDNKFNDLGVEGNTEQEQLTGIQLFNKNGEIVYNNFADLTVLNTGVKATTNTSDKGASYGSIKIPNAENLLGETLTLYCKATPNTNRVCRINVAFINSSGVYVSQIARLDLSGTGTITNIVNFNVPSEFPTNAVGIALLFYGSITTTVQGEYVDYTDVRLYKGSYTVSNIPDYEPFVGGIPSPNPDFPQQIYNVTGDVNVKIQNKNLFDKNTAKQNYILNANGEEVSSTGSFVSDYILLKAGTNYYNNTRGYSNAGFFDLNKTFIERATLSQNNIITVAKNCYVKVNGTLANIDNYQLEENTSATSYIPHQEQNYPLTLGNIELNKIDTAQDYFYKSSGKWYLHKEIDKVVLNGTENWGEITGAYYYTITEMKKQGYALSSHFKYTRNRVSLLNEYEFTTVSGDGYSVWIKQIESSIDNLKTWLSTHNTEVYYELATPTNTEVTDTTLINQLNAIKEAMSYYEQTNISSTSSEISAIIEANAVGDLNLIIS